ncbi:MAG: hypothetical protein KF763_21275, partial [Cyclobacteriaceae bacterium]|nr:hypothetical protein [Cyclobacteriaceae bacterium]
MTSKIIGTIGICITLLFVISYVSLFIYNPQTLEEVDKVTSIAAFNITGMNGRWIIAYLNYLTIGLLNLVFVFGLFKNSKNDLPIIIGKILILISGLIWTSFGVMSWDAFSDIGIHTVMIRVIVLLTVTPLGLIFLATEMEKVVKDKFSKYYTLTTGLLILLLGILSVFVYNDQTWMRTNVSIAIYFLWFGVFGLRLVQ